MDELAPKPPKHILLTGPHPADARVLEIPATSEWHDLLPQHQEVAIKPYAGPINTPRP